MIEIANPNIYELTTISPYLTFWYEPTTNSYYINGESYVDIDYYFSVKCPSCHDGYLRSPVQTLNPSQYICSKECGLDGIVWEFPIKQSEIIGDRPPP